MIFIRQMAAAEYL